MKKPFAILSSCIACAANVANAADVTPAASVDDFLWSIGVCSSLTRRGESIHETIANLKYTGIRWVRTGYEEGVPLEDNIAIHNATGVKFSYGMLSGHSDVDRLLRSGKILADAGALLALEGSNEPNNFGPIVWEGETGGQFQSWLPVAKMHRDLYAMAKADPVLKDYPVWHLCENGAQIDNCGLQFLTIPEGAAARMPEDAPLLMPEGTKFADYANCHNYICHPEWPGTHPTIPGLNDNQTWLSAQPGPECPVDGLYGNYGLTWRNKFPGYTIEELKTLPRVTTETGIHMPELPEELQGKLYLNLYLSQFANGFKHTAIYLLKGRADEPGDNPFAFFNLDNSPKQCAHHLHNFTTILDDRKPVTEFKPLNYSIADMPETSHDLLLQRSNGNHVLILWGERFVSPGSDDIVVKLGKPARAVLVYNPVVGTAVQRMYTDVDTIPVSLTDHPFILEIIQ